MGKPKSIRLAFTKRRLEMIPIPEVGQVQFRDADCPGLALRVSCGGSKTFIRYGRIEGRPTRVYLGRFPEMSVEQARKTCQVAGGDIAKGDDPHARRLAKRHEQTLQGLWEHWLAMAETRKRTWREDERQYQAFLESWGSRRLSCIKKAEVQAIHARIGREHGPYAANRLLALLRAMFNTAGDIGYLGENPATKIKRFPEVKRDRFLHGDELPRFFSSLKQEPELFRDFFSICLLTGARRANVQAMRWDDVDLERGLWRIPGQQAKAGETIVVPLSPEAVEILKKRRASFNGSDWVFPSHSKTGHLTEPKFAWQRILSRAGLADVRLHDLRRTLGSWMAMGGAGLPIIGKLLGHRQHATTAIYARLQVDPVREHVNAATAAILAAGKVKLVGHELQPRTEGESNGKSEEGSQQS